MKNIFSDSSLLKNIYTDSSRERLDSVRKKDKYKRHLLSKLIKWGPIVLSLIFFDFIFALFFCVIWWFLTTLFVDYQFIFDFVPCINVWFGLAGSGKTTMAALLTSKFRKSHYTVLSNVPIKGTYILDKDDLGNVDMSFGGSGAEVIIDEAIDGFDSRNFKEFAHSSKPLYFATQRHQNNRVDVFSQGYDIDKRIRDRGKRLYYLQPSFLSGFVVVKRIKKILYINKEDKQFVDGFEFKGLPRIIYAKSVWGSFDTLDMSLIPDTQKDWKEWYAENDYE